MLPLGTPLPAFELPDFNGRIHSSSTFSSSPALLVAFLCPHCPYVKHVRTGLGRFAADYAARGLAVVGINANDTAAHPDDDAVGMKREAEVAGYTFPYLIDEAQDVARAFQAACTPDFFLFDGERRWLTAGSSMAAGPGAQTL